MNKNIEKKIEVDGVKFIIGKQNDCEFSGPIFEMVKDGKKYGVGCVSENQRELGFNSGVFATDKELEAIKKAEKILKELIGSLAVY